MISRIAWYGVARERKKVERGGGKTMGRRALSPSQVNPRSWRYLRCSLARVMHNGYAAYRRHIVSSVAHHHAALCAASPLNNAA